jgi:hypothetical protein
VKQCTICLLLKINYAHFETAYKEVAGAGPQGGPTLLLVKGFGADMEYKKNPRTELSFDPGISLFYPRKRDRICFYHGSLYPSWRLGQVF